MIEHKDISDFSREELLRLAALYFGEVLVHYGLWFSETAHAYGADMALNKEDETIRRYFAPALKRLAPHLGIELEGDLPKAVASKSKEELLLMIGDIAKTWVAGDGMWFQALENAMDMTSAKLVNDACWSRFAEMEAFKIKRFLNIGEAAGLDALDKALRLRIYSTINGYTLHRDAEGALIFAMTECRVQSARRRKKLDDYPCKSAGMVEHTRFAAAIDPRLQTECVRCPPDEIPDGGFCMWRFTLKE
jgi:hypothetical protein